MNKKTALLIAGAAALAVAAPVAYIALGAYDVSATTPHFRPVYKLLEVTMQRSVQQRSRDIQLPPLHDPQLQALGAACFRQHCVACHGAPGVAPGAFAMGLQPVPRSLMDAGRSMSPQALYWATRQGIKMSGMPAWEFRLSETELQAVTAFVTQRLPSLSTPEYRALDAQTAALSCGVGEPVGSAGSGGMRARGELALRQHACTACHVIPGVTGPDSGVGPSLEGFGRRQLIAGRLPNTAANLERWIREPQAVRADTAMPDLRVGEQAAREMAAYLGALR